VNEVSDVFEFTVDMDYGPQAFKLQLTNPRVQITSPLDKIDNIDRVNGCILVYDITDRESLESFFNWWKVLFFPRF
jgi:hypothetical protein